MVSSWFGVNALSWRLLISRLARRPAHRYWRAGPEHGDRPAQYHHL